MKGARPGMRQSIRRVPRSSVSEGVFPTLSQASMRYGSSSGGVRLTAAPPSSFCSSSTNSA